MYVVTWAIIILDLIVYSLSLDKNVYQNVNIIVQSHMKINGNNFPHVSSFYHDNLSRR